MIKSEEEEKITKEIVIKYFKKDFLGKNIETILYNISKDVLLELGKIHTIFQIKKYCLSKIEEDSDYMKLIQPEMQKNIHETILGLDEICNHLEEIINPILEELNK